MLLISIICNCQIIFENYIYESSYNEIVKNQNIFHQDEVDFIIEDKVIYTTMVDKSKFTLLETISNGSDSTLNWIKYKCFDINEKDCFVTFAFDKVSSTDLIIIDYNNCYLYFEVFKKQEMIKMDNGYLGDSLYKNTYTDKEVKEFLSKFGDPEKIIKLLILNLY